MRYGSVYLVVRDFNTSLDFYEKVFNMKVSARNGDRFAMFANEGLNLCLMNGYYDTENPDKVITRGESFPEYDDARAIAESENTRKVFINLYVPDLRAEYGRIRALGIVNDLTPIRYIEVFSPYWYFTFQDPDGNPIEITGGYEEADYSTIIGTTVSGKVDRPLGTAHPRHPDMIYPINYGYVEGVFAADGAEQDVYIFGKDEPIEEYTGKVIAVYHRTNDVEDKWIVSLDGRDYSNGEILAAIEFQEQYFEGYLVR